LVKKDLKFRWTPECETAFQTLKTALISEPILQLPQIEMPFAIASDASLEGTGFILMQMNDQVSKYFFVITYGGSAMKEYQKKYTVAELETLAIIQCCRISSSI
jgi:RNase H-like domain found in reverse transcriptase